MASVQEPKKNLVAEEVFALRKLKLGDQISNMQGMGEFMLPATFKSKELSSKYVKLSEVEAHKVERPMAGLPYAEPAWTVWLSGDKTPHYVQSGDTKFVLLCRPLQQTRAVEEAYAEHSRDMLRNDTATRHALAKNKEGMLTAEQIDD